MKVIKELLKLLKPYRWLVLLSVLLNWGTISSSIGLLMSSAFIISKAALHPSVAEIQVAIVGVRLFGILRGILRYLERLVSHTVNFKLLASLRVWFYTLVEPLVPSGWKNHDSGDLHQRVINDIETLKYFYIRLLGPAVTAILVAITISLLLRPIDYRLTLLMFVFFFIAGIIIPYSTLMLTRSISAEMIRLRSNYHVFLKDTLQGMTDLMAYNQMDSRMSFLNEWDDKLLKYQRNIKNISSLQEHLNQWLMMINSLIALWWTIPRVANYELDGVMLAVIVLGIMAAFEAVIPLPSAFSFYEQSRQSWQRITELAHPKIMKKSSALACPNSEIHSIEFREVSLNYDSDFRGSALKNISFKVNKGEKLLILGATGAGKSSLINLLLKFWQPDHGHILLNSEDIDQYEAESLRKMFAFVSQKNHFFNAAIMDNLKLSDPETDDNTVINAAQLTGIHSLINSLPQGYQTFAGEGGVKFSGGERQRLAIARALIKNARILILDEPTAHLDSDNEENIFQMIRLLDQFDQIWLISHRIKDISFYDKVLILENGQIAEFGIISQLLADDSSILNKYRLSQHLVIGL